MRFWGYGGAQPIKVAATAFLVISWCCFTFIQKTVSQTEYVHVCDAGSEEIRGAANSTISFQCGPALTLAPEPSSNMVYRGASCTEKAELARLIPGVQLLSDTEYIRKGSRRGKQSPVHHLKIDQGPTEDTELCYRCLTPSRIAKREKAQDEYLSDRGQRTVEIRCKIVIRVAAAPKPPLPTLAANLGRSLSLGVAFLTGLCF